MRTFLKKEKGLSLIENWEPGSWINIECPTQQELDYLTETLQVPTTFLNDIEDFDERPRIENEEDWQFIIIRIPYRDLDSSLQYTTIPLGIIIKDDLFVSICYGKTDMIADFIQYTQRKAFVVNNNLELFLRMLLSSSIWFMKYLKQINLETRAAEKQLEKSVRNEELQTLLQLEKCLVFFITSLKGNAILFNKMKSLKRQMTTDDEELIEDVEIEIRQALEMANIYSDILSGMMDAYASVISNNVNAIMKRLTSISIVIMIPTLIASLYGMNVPNNFSESRFGFLFILLGSFAISTFIVILFRKKNWF